MSRRLQLRSAVLALLVVTMACAAAHADDALPRYRLEPGRHLTYEGSEVAVTSTSRLGLDRTSEILVVRANPDGSSRLIVSQTFQRFNERNGERTTMPQRTDTFVVDVFPDGRIIDRGQDSYGLLNRLIPRLPANEREAREGWAFDASDVRVECGPAADVDSASRRWAFHLTPVSDMWRIHRFEATFRYEFDLAGGVVAAFSGQHRARGNDTRKETERLVADKRLEAGALATLAAEIDEAVEARTGYRRAVAKALVSGDVKAGRAMIDAAFAKLERTHAAVTSERLRATLDRVVREHRTGGDALDKRIALNARILGRAAPTWALTDLDGREHRLSDYAGRVIVLDFWYKNCGWCIRAMPQVRSLVRRFAGRPVAVLGMNTDREEADARSVTEQLEFNYPTLLADRDLARAYGVQAYPTLLVVDGHGVVRYVHRGYSWRLEKELAEVIEELLEAE
ncbi:MAG: TlpA family protein disulfide reductase [Planctomycetes bacterium]|nr:TlpA family protein disulfide reductase [Planctomycetota bacterium]